MKYGLTSPPQKRPPAPLLRSVSESNVQELKRILMSGACRGMLLLLMLLMLMLMLMLLVVVVVAVKALGSFQTRDEARHFHTVKNNPPLLVSFFFFSILFLFKLCGPRT